MRDDACGLRGVGHDRIVWVGSHWLSSLAVVLFAWTTLATRGLDDAAKTVELGLHRDDENAARSAMPSLVGHDPDNLIAHQVDAVFRLPVRLSM